MSTRARRVPRPPGDLQRELVDQLQLLRHACESFDQGMQATGRHIALSLRVLFHEYRQSRALLEQLHLRSGRFLDSAGPLNPRNMLSDSPLIVMEATESGVSYVPLVAVGGGPLQSRMIPFVDWWNSTVVKDSVGRTFNRRELVMHIADTDGGAHVDPELDEAYMALSRQNSLGWTFNVGEGHSPVAGRAELACIRQIAHEVLVTLSQTYPDLAVHAAPVIPNRAA